MSLGILISGNLRNTNEGGYDESEGNHTRRNFNLGLQPRLAYIMAVIFLATLLITQVVAAALNGNGGGGPHLVK